MGCLFRTIGLAMLLVFLVVTGMVLLGILLQVGAAAGAIPASGSVHISFFPFMALFLLMCVGLYVFLVLRRKNDQATSHENRETQLLHDMFEGLERLEERIENLESILYADDKR